MGVSYNAHPKQSNLGYLRNLNFNWLNAFYIKLLTIANESVVEQQTVRVSTDTCSQQEAQD